MGSRVSASRGVTPHCSLLSFQKKSHIMSDEEYYEEEETTSTKGGSLLKGRGKAGKGELDEQLREYINEWRSQRAKEEEELKRLKEKQAKRKEIRAEQEKKLAAQKKEETLGGSRDQEARNDASTKRETSSLWQGWQGRWWRWHGWWCTGRSQGNDQNQGAT